MGRGEQTTAVLGVTLSKMPAWSSLTLRPLQLDAAEIGVRYDRVRGEYIYTIPMRI
jgi:hypothetical protein